MAPGTDEVTKHSVHTLVFRSQKRSHDMFISDQGNLPESDKDLDEKIKKLKARSFYGQGLVNFVETQKLRKSNMEPLEVSESTENSTSTQNPTPETSANPSTNSSNQLAVFTGGNQIQTKRKAISMAMPKPNWHAPWKLYRVISGTFLDDFLANVVKLQPKCSQNVIKMQPKFSQNAA